MATTASHGPLKFKQNQAHWFVLLLIWYQFSNHQFWGLKMLLTQLRVSVNERAYYLCVRTDCSNWDSAKWLGPRALNLEIAVRTPVGPNLFFWYRCNPEVKLIAFLTYSDLEKSINYVWPTTLLVVWFKSYIRYECWVLYSVESYTFSLTHWFLYVVKYKISCAETGFCLLYRLCTDTLLISRN